MKLRDLENKCDKIRDAFHKIVNDSECMFFALEDIYGLCLEADENNWRETIDAIKEIAGRLT
jgi:uncharacterized protein Yka (UPF0111/DUF47 family)